MRIEHIAWQVEDADAVAGWYIEHLNFEIRRHVGGPAHTYFLADSSGDTVIEIYTNTAVAVPDYRNINPLLLHLALVTDDNAADVARLTAAGATIASETEVTPVGDTLTMLRDPWGFALQLCKRAKSMLKE